MNQNFDNSNSSGFDQFQPPQYPVVHHSPQETSEEVLQAREDLMKVIQTFLRKFSRIPFGVIPKGKPKAKQYQILTVEEPDNSYKIDEDDCDEDYFDDKEEEIDIFQIKDEILREKLLNVNLLVDKIEALKLTPSFFWRSILTHLSPIPVVDSEFLVEEVDTCLVPEESIPPGIKSDFDSEGDIVFLDNLLNEDPILRFMSVLPSTEPDCTRDN
ncbi:hypothetical protein Tco_0114966 [Tanacetum coccineum]